MDTLNLSELVRAFVVIVLGASGTWLLLPHRHGFSARATKGDAPGRVRGLNPLQLQVIGGSLAASALIVLATLWSPPGSFVASTFFYGFGLAAVAAAVLTITSRDPIYSALWFAAVVLATSGLFLLAGAQFLAAGTIIVYAGAIIVTFLFVIMLAQSEGRSTYDRTARAPGRATLTCFLLFWSVLYALMMVKHPMGYDPRSDVGDGQLVRGWNVLKARRVQPDLPVAAVVGRSFSATGRLPEAGENTGAGRHVAGLGATLYTDHLVTVELAGALLFVALIGALAIASPRPPSRDARGVRPSPPNPLA